MYTAENHASKLEEERSEVRRDKEEEERAGDTGSKEGIPPEKLLGPRSTEEVEPPDPSGFSRGKEEERADKCPAQERQ